MECFHDPNESQTCAAQSWVQSCKIPAVSPLLTRTPGQDCFLKQDDGKVYSVDTKGAGMWIIPSLGKIPKSQGNLFWHVHMHVCVLLCLCVEEVAVGKGGGLCA